MKVTGFHFVQTNEIHKRIGKDLPKTEQFSIRCLTAILESFVFFPQDDFPQLLILIKFLFSSSKQKQYKMDKEAIIRRF